MIDLVIIVAAPHLKLLVLGAILTVVVTPMICLEYFVYSGFNATDVP
jgi:hypothetical protein